ncbi:hypothetical protein HCJ58_01565 [Listeria sp. FSL L7-1509]|uniref:Uncharacterized protein n=1 Tax=Listeria immobilis TaxID=2713502 RepID=A0ABR6SSP8_9LIST|nr:hypothetical protein [Listeria immobilis]MBC1483327.1 hypothetical protein [Listeria immobilis]MBC1505674.1 hypothetical protein [Listeria immobilis]MBC1508535.1 hypothetical protein [Listeria immobilis]MBC6302054.1 hypothetical protein [Listeria immobilis]MBC6311033.1 hypothetical protein [Listeria immobilis]
MKYEKIITVLLVSILSFNFTPLVVRANVITSATEEIQLSKNPEKNNRSNLKAPKRVGEMKIWVTNSPKRINWKVTMTPPYKATGFKGMLNIADLYHGSTQRVSVSGLKGYISQPMLKSQYMASVSGKVTPVGYAMGSSAIRWNN